MAEIASAFVTIAPSARGFGTSLNRQVGSDVKSAGSTMGRTFGKLFALGAGVIAAAGIGRFLKGSIDEAREAQKVGAQTGAVLKSTGAIANVSAKQIDRLAASLSAKIGVDDEAIQAGENMLLTFTKVRNEAGKGNDIFTRATRTVQDMAAAFKGDAVTNSKILGKALNDPIRGVSALTRVGVSFTQGQKDQIETMVESGNVMGAQKLILAELAKQTKGSAEAQATAGDKARVAFENLQETIGTALLPVIDKLANIFTKDVAPAVTTFIEQMQSGEGAGGEFADKVKNLGVTLRDDVLPPLKTLGEIGSGIVQFFSDLPGPVKSFAVQVGVASVLLIKMNTALTGMKFTSFITDIRTAETRTAALGRAARTTAGIAGIAALTAATKTSSDKMKFFATVAGGAALGFSVGGPWGAAIGTVGGMVKGVRDLNQAMDNVAQRVRTARDDVQNYADSLNQASGASTKLTKSLVLEEARKSGVLLLTSQLGVANRDVIGAVLGNEGATRRLSGAMRDHIGALTATEQVDLQTWLRDNTAAMRDQADQVRQNHRDTQSWAQALKGLPPEVKTRVKEIGTDATLKQLRNLKRQYDLNPKQVRTIVNAIGTDAAARKIKGVWTVLEDGKRIKAEDAINPFIQTFVAGIDRAGRSGRQKMDQTLGGLVTATKKTKPDLQPFGNDLQRQLAAMRGGIAIPGGTGIGSGLQAGFGGGFGGAIASWSAQVRAAVAAAIRAGRQEAGVRSPSKVTEELGEFIGEGLAQGIESKQKRVAAAMQHVIDGLKSKLSNFRSDFASLSDSISGAFTGNLFESETASGFIANLLDTKGRLQGLKAAFKKLIGFGIKPAFLSQLFASGNGGLILDLAAGSKAQATQSANLFGQVTSLSSQLADKVAKADIGPKIDRTNQTLEDIADLIKKLPPGIGKEINGAARSGRQRANV